MRWMMGCLLAATTGCFSPSYQNGEIHCKATAANVCPDGYHCAIDHTCWHNGQEPPPQHSATVTIGAGGGIGDASGGAHRITTSFGQLAGTSSGAGLHSIQFGAVAGTAAQ
jgi:hypothetical protein